MSIPGEGGLSSAHMGSSRRCPKSVEALEQQAFNEKGEPEKFNGAATVDDFNDAQGYFIVRKFGLTRPKVKISPNNWV